MPKFILRNLDDYSLCRVQLLSDGALVVEIAWSADCASRIEVIAPQEYNGPGGGWSDEELDGYTPAFDNDE